MNSLKFLSGIIILSLASTVVAQTNYGFESGNLTGWTAGGGTGTKAANSWSGNGIGVAVVTGMTNFSPGGGNTWNVTPYGTHMASIQPGTGAGTFDQMTSSLGLAATSNQSIRTMLNTQAQSGGGNPTPTNASWVSKTVTLVAGQTYTMAWQYISSDYTPYNDGSIMTLSKVGDATKGGVLNNSAGQYALLGFTNPGTGNYSTNSYGSTGWQVATYTVNDSGDYVLGFASFNLGDTALSPILLIDETQGQTTLNGTAFSPVPPNAGSTAPPAPPPPPPALSLCCGGSAASFSIDAAKNASVQSFINRTTGDSKVFIEQIGSQNLTVVQQTGTRNNYFEYNINGNSNNASVTQTGTASTTVNYMKVDVNGSSNTLNLLQNSTGGAKGAFINVNNNNNTVNLQQKDSGSHYANIELTGGSKTVDIIQEGTGSHMTNINLSGNPTGLSLTQSGSTQQFYSITHNCATAGGCSAITVTQGN
jgi:hypothetical protein